MPADTPPLDELRALHAAVEDADAALAAARDRRDAEVVRLHRAGVSKYRIAKELGLSQPGVTKIVRAADQN